MEKMENNSDLVKIYYEKNSLYRTIYTDGAIGGRTPLGQINLTFYATRQAIPKAVNHKLSEKGEVMELVGISEDSKSGIIREMEMGVYMTEQTAKDLYLFLKKMFEDGNR